MTDKCAAGTRTPTIRPCIAIKLADKTIAEPRSTIYKDGDAGFMAGASRSCEFKE